MVSSCNGVSIRGLFPIMALVTACLLWGTSDVVAKTALNSMPPICLTTLRFLIAALVLWPMSRRVTHDPIPVRETLPLGIVGISGMFLLQNFGLDRIAAANASLLGGAMPAVILIVAAILIRERISLRGAMGIGMAAIGVIAMSSSSGFGPGSIGLGDGLVLASITLFAVFTVLSRNVFRRYGTIPTLFAVTFWGSITLVPAAGAEIAIVRPDRPDTAALVAVLYLGICCSAAAFALWGFAQQHLMVGCIAAFDALIPVTGCAAAVLVLGEELTRNHLLGGGAVIAALLLIACGSSELETHESTEIKVVDALSVGRLQPAI